MKKRKSAVLIAVFFVFGFVWISWDMYHSFEKDKTEYLEILSVLKEYSYDFYKPLSEFDNISETGTVVAVVRSDDKTLTDPVSVNSSKIDYKTIEQMVRRAVELAGGFNGIIKTGNRVLIKPNIVTPQPYGSGEVTDVRVVKALIRLIDGIDHGKIEIIIGEGSPRPMEHEMKYQTKFKEVKWKTLWDASGYQDLLNDPDLKGINLRFSNLNGSPEESPWDDLKEVNLPEYDALGQKGRFYIHKDVIDADVYISVPVMKIHNTGITVGLKNQIGIAPSTRYGFSKTDGVAQDNYKTKLIHGAEAPKYWTDKEIVDLTRIAKVKFVVVDAIACLESNKAALWSNGSVQNLVRMNTIIAGKDIVAVDNVCSRLMGLNPDDIEHITLAEKRGLGMNDPAKIKITGADLDKIKKKFRKEASATGDYGQGNRIWLISRIFNAEGIKDTMNYEFIKNEKDYIPKKEIDGWSKPLYFTDDRIDLTSYFKKGGESFVSYAFVYFDALKDQDAELWIGSDEAVKIYINGKTVYNFNGSRIFSRNDIVSDKVRINISAGQNVLLVKSYQKKGLYDFSLNICQPDDSLDHDGSRVWGLKFRAE